MKTADGDEGDDATTEAADSDRFIGVGKLTCTHMFGVLNEKKKNVKRFYNLI